MSASESTRGVPPEDILAVFDERDDSAEPLTAPEVAESRNAVSIQHDLLDRGEQVGEVDVLVAGTAVERAEDVLTRNVGEFSRVDDLAVETY